jgi:hypothetical protein
VLCSSRPSRRLAQRLCSSADALQMLCRCLQSLHNKLTASELTWRSMYVRHKHARQQSSAINIRAYVYPGPLNHNQRCKEITASTTSTHVPDAGPVGLDAAHISTKQQRTICYWSPRWPTSSRRHRHTRTATYTAMQDTAVQQDIRSK